MWRGDSRGGASKRASLSAPSAPSIAPRIVPPRAWSSDSSNGLSSGLWSNGRSKSFGGGSTRHRRLVQRLVVGWRGVHRWWCSLPAGSADPRARARRPSTRAAASGCAPELHYEGSDDLVRTHHPAFERFATKAAAANAERSGTRTHSDAGLD